MITTYSIIFHYLMAAEGRDHSWLTGFYWTLTVMSTLGFGDITFSGDMGRLFSIIVMLSGVIFLLVMLPFTFIQFFYAPWVEAERKSRTPRVLPSHIRDHVIITAYNPVTAALIERLNDRKKDYTLMADDLQRALEFYDMDIKTSVGLIDDPATYLHMRASSASMVVAVNSDEVNTNVAFTVREINETVPIICTAESPDAVDILTMAGATLVLQLSDMLGRSLARRTIGGDTRINEIGAFEGLVFTETPVTGTPFPGKTLGSIKLREITGVTAVAMWDRGKLIIPDRDTPITQSTVLILAGSAEQMMKFEELICIYQPVPEPVIIIGAGRVGISAAASFTERNIPFIFIEKDSGIIPGNYPVIHGNAADLATLTRAGIKKTPAAVLTTNDDAVNIYLTKYCRSLRRDMQIISRSTVDRNVSTLHRAGADFVMSYAALGAGTIFNYLESGNILMLTEGLNIFKAALPARYAGKNLADLSIRQDTGCSVIAVKTGEESRVNPDPFSPLPEGCGLILIGTSESEKSFIKKYSG
jgi:Trk K+ transport system NAD-binding subunit